jgi:hypothetical protein
MAPSGQLTVDFRCPVHTRRLFFRLLRTPGARIDPTSNLLEIRCRDCGGVLHRYNLLGELVETITPAG